MDRRFRKDAVTAAGAYLAGLFALAALLDIWAALVSPIGTRTGPFLFLIGYGHTLAGAVGSGAVVFAAAFWLRDRVPYRWLVAGIGIGILFHATTLLWWAVQGVTGPEAAQYASILGTGLKPSLAIGVTAHLIERTGLPDRMLAGMDQHT